MLFLRSLLVFPSHPILVKANIAPNAGFQPMRLRGGGLDTQRTYAMIKPDAVKAGKVDEMQSLIKAAGFKIIKQKQMTLSKSTVRCVPFCRLPQGVTHCQRKCHVPVYRAWPS